MTIREKAVKKYDDDYLKSKYAARGIKFETGFQIPNTNWTLVDERIYHKNGVKVKVSCSCGKEFLRALSALTHKNPVKSCLKCKQIYSTVKAEQDWVGTKGIPTRYYSRTKDGAKKRDLPFELSNEQMYSLYLAQTQSCALTGVPISFTANNASLDRIDSSGGYTVNNVQWVHKDINRMKNVFPQEHFVSLCHAVASNTPKPNNIFEKLGFKPNGA
jgi:hypothetical protein